MGEPIRGSLGVASSFQLTEQMEALDKQSKNLLQYREVLAVILKHTLEEYADYTVAEVMDFIDVDSITGSMEVSRDRTNARIQGRSTEFAELNEKTTYFDSAFLARNPKLSGMQLLVHLHINVEAQKEYRPGYPVEKRGIYSKRQINLPFTIALRGMRTIFARKFLRLHAAKIGAGNVIKKTFMTFPIILPGPQAQLPVGSADGADQLRAA